MAHSVSLPDSAARVEPPSAAIGMDNIPWYVWCFVVAATSAVIGGVWDISWHKSIGRDSFWSPPHILIYLCGVLAGLGAGYLILATTLDSGAPLREASVRMWGFRGPLGAFLCAWGGVAMLASAPFDDWWHNAFGLDVKILSPPHVVLILGILAIRFGALLMILGCMNRAAGRLRAKLNWLFLYVGTILLGGTLGSFQELTARNYMHTARFYLVVALITPLVLLAVVRASGHRWGATIVAGLFTLVAMLFVWILPLFPAEPKLGPVYQTVTRFVPNDFPMLILPAAVLIDLLRRRIADWSLWRQAAAAGCLFFAAFLAVQWPFANFLMSPWSRNWFFGTHHLPFFVPPDHDYARYVFTTVESAAGFWLQIALAAVAAIVSARLGLAWGEWMCRIRR